MRGAPRFALSPSRIARFFFHECERNLRYLATLRKKEEGVPSTPADRSPVAEAILAGGYTWERDVVSGLLGARAHVAAPAAPNQPLHECVHSEAETVALLSRLQPGEAVYQGTLRVSERFLERFGLDPALVTFSPCRPDLLVRDPQSKRVQVVDVKASQELKASHRIQAALYGLMLEDVAQQHQLPIDVDATYAGIWLYGHDAPELFDLSLTRNALDRFLRERLPAILSQPLASVGWHLHFRCEWCEYFQHCRQEAEQTKSVSQIPYLTVAARDYLRVAESSIPVDTLEDLRRLLGRDDAEELLALCGSLKGQQHRLRHAVDALEQGTVVSHEGASLALPKHEHVMLVITVQREPFSGRIYAAAFRRNKGRDVYGNGASSACFVAPSPDGCADVCAQFVTALHAELEQLHAFNEGKQWGDQKSLQTYVFDTYEGTLFNELLFEAATRPELSTKALSLLFHFQDESLASADEQPKTEVPFPVVVITSVLRDLVAMPSPVAVRLGDAARHAPSPSYPAKYEQKGLFDFELSNALKSDAIFEAWREDSADAIDRIELRLKQRLLVTATVIDGLRAKVEGRLFAWAPRFALPAAFAYRHAELSRLAFIVQYECFMGALATREMRTRPLAERLASGTTVRLVYEGQGWWRPADTLDAVNVRPGLFNRLLVPEGDEGERAQMAYDDHRNRQAHWAPKNSVVRLAHVPGDDAVELDPATGFVRRLELELKTAPDQPSFTHGAVALLHPRFADFTSHRVLTRLGEIDQERDSDFVRLLRAPAEFSAPVPVDAALGAALAGCAHSGFTPAQARAYEHLWRRRLTLVWGPPGTGKTHFLSHAIVSFAAAYIAQGIPVRIGVTAFTHTAAEHLLKGIAAAAAERTVPVSVHKLEKTSSASLSVPVLEIGAAVAMPRRGAQVLGCTAHSIRKAIENGMLPFDVLVVDEASQVRMGDLALATLALGAGARLVLAGDDQQLPPIIHGAYPEPDDGLPGLHASAFEYLRKRDESASPFTCQLGENWRMNTTLSALPARALYGPGYRPANEEIARRAVRLGPRRSTGHPSEALLDWLLDPEWPLAVCILEDVRATAENLVEAELVGRLALDLRGRLQQRENDRPYPAGEDGDRAFLRDGLFIVSPHHVQIRAIRRALGTQWKSSPFVDTVDKMQGQECDVVLVSYGVSDQETALAEAQFIYSLERLNVSTTRARAKCITFLPRPLLEPRFDLLSDEKASRGLGHMYEMLGFCREYGESRSWNLNWLASGESHRLTTLRARRD